MKPLRVLVTRALHQASELADALRNLGAEPILIPAIEIAAPLSFAMVDAALAHVGSFNWLVFTSANAVEALRKHAPTFEIPLHLRVAGIGPATTRALNAVYGKPQHEILQPQQAVAESLAESLVPFAKQPNGVATRFLLVRAEEARDHLPDTLRMAGAHVTIAPAYRNVIPKASVLALRALLSEPADTPEVITFTSSSTATNFFRLLEATQLCLPQDVLLASIGPITSETLCDLGHPPHIESKDASVISLATELVAFCAARNSEWNTV